MKQSIEALQWRYATKKFDATKKLSEEQLHTLTESLRLSASSYGLQPWKFFIVSNPALREKLQAAAYNQPQITEASHLIVIAAKKQVDEAHVDAFFESIMAERGATAEQLQGYKDMVLGTVHRLTPEQMMAWNIRQSYIALGTLLTVAAYEEIDACPMEGFDPAAFDALLGLSEQGLTTAVVCPVGFRSSEDGMAQYKKVRFPEASVITEIK